MPSHLNRKSLRNAVATLAIFLTLTATSSAQGNAARNALANVRISNFGQMDERFYRGGQPKNLEDYKALAALGINTVIDLRDDPKEYERPFVESLGMRYVHIPMSSRKYPPEKTVQAFLRTVNDPRTGKFFVHCAGGRHRTGAMGAVYRYTFYNWNFEQVYSEMKRYDFYTFGGHAIIKKFAQDYYTLSQANRNASSPAAINDATQIESNR